MINLQNVHEFNDKYQSMHPKDILADAFEMIPDIAISFSGAEDVALIAMAWKINKNVRVFSLDTGRLPSETYEFMEQVRNHYGIDIEFMTPNAERLQAMVSKKGLFSFYTEGHDECCGIRKVEPLRRKLAELDGWISGQRRDQSPTRTDVPVVEWDRASSTAEKPLFKFNPLANWSSAQVWEYIRMFDVPYNKLHDQGYISIGCQPCTRPVGPNQHEREGRWWWEEATAKECGLHLVNVTDKSAQ